MNAIWPPAVVAMVTLTFSRLRLAPGAIGAGGAANVRIFPSPGLSGGSVNSWIIFFLCHWSLLGGVFWVREFFSYFFSRDRFTQTAEIFATLKKVSLWEAARGSLWGVGPHTGLLGGNGAGGRRTMLLSPRHPPYTQSYAVSRRQQTGSRT